MGRVLILSGPACPPTAVVATRGDLLLFLLFNFKKILVSHHGLEKCSKNNTLYYHKSCLFILMK